MGQRVMAPPTNDDHQTKKESRPMLSDSCFDFLSAIAQGKNATTATSELIQATQRYDHEPFDYGPEIGILRNAAEVYLDNPDAPSLRDQLLSTACSVMNFHDWAPTHQITDFATFVKTTARPAIVDMATLATWWQHLE
jgi:hypothetical protein